MAYADDFVLNVYDVKKCMVTEWKTPFGSIIVGTPPWSA